MTKQRIKFVSFIFLSMAVFSEQTLPQAANANRTDIAQETEKSKFIKKIAESLIIKWSSIEYKNTLYNPAHTSNTQGQPKAESLFIACEFEMPDSGLILTTCPDVVIKQITDSRGSNIEIDPLPRSTFIYIHQPRSKRGFMPEGQLSKPEYSHLWVELDEGLPEHVSGKIGLKGYFYALIAESLEYVELPFEPNDNWVRLTPDVEIRVRQARNEASMYRFKIEQRPEIVADMFDVQIGDPLPDRLIVDRQIIVKRSAMGAGGGGASGRIGGTGSGTGRAEKIRFTIAVNPTHQKIPFKLEQIPLTVLAEPALSQTGNSNRTEHNSVKKLSEHLKPQFNKKVAKWFDVKWNSISYSKKLFNPMVYTNSENQFVSEKLFVRLQAEILDPELVVGTCDIPVIEYITDGKGQDANISRAQPRTNRMSYRTLQYQPTLIPTPPSMLIQLERQARLALGLPLRARHLPKRSLELQPVRLRIDLDPNLLRQDIQEVRNIKGYFHALTAESSKHVEVPFKPDNKWVQLTSDIEIQVRKAWHTGTMARFDIRQRGLTGAAASHLYVGDSLPDEIVVERQFIGKGSRPKHPIKLGRFLPGSIGGSGSCDIGQQIEKIDYLIAVDPNHNRIPFELKHIPLPKP